MTAHTPGPWAAIGTDVKTPGPRSRILCWTGQPEVEMSEARANARLIAAAPDMLATLRLVETIAKRGIWHQSSLSHAGLVELLQEACEEVQHAIAEAGG